MSTNMQPSFVNRPFQSSLRSVHGLLQVGLHRPHAHGAQFLCQLRRILLRQYPIQGKGAKAPFHRQVNFSCKLNEQAHLRYTRTSL